MDAHYGFSLCRNGTSAKIHFVLPSFEFQRCFEQADSPNKNVDRAERLIELLILTFDFGSYYARD